MKNIVESCTAILAPVREALRTHSAASAQAAELARLEDEREAIKAKVAAAPTSTAALAFVDDLAKIEAKVTIAKVREPIDHAALSKASQAADQALSEAILEFSTKVVEPLENRIRDVAWRFAYVFTMNTADGVNSSGLVGPALQHWWGGTNHTLSTEARLAALEALVPLLPAAFDRVAKLEKAAGVVADLDDR